MPDITTPESISYIKIGSINHPIDAVTVEGKSISSFQLAEGLVTSIDSNSDDTHYPSAKCVYDIIYGNNEPIQQLNSVSPRSLTLNSSPGIDYSGLCLTYDIISSGTIIWRKLSNNSTSKTIYYRINNGNWANITANSTTGNSINVNAGDKVEFKGYNSTYGESINDGYNFNGTAIFDLSGNIMSLINGDDFYNAELSSNNDYVFNKFWYNSNVRNASNLILPSNVCRYCYNSMFASCACLSSTPGLPATTLADYCYNSMFNGCNILMTTPELPATTLASYCYSNMFYGCTSLTSITGLPATTLASYCYYNMFSGCTSLTSIPELPATTLVNSCYQYMFSDCTGLTSTPDLPAMTLVNYCYSNMFKDCTNLNNVKCFATDISANSCTSNWLSGVSQTGTFIKNPNMSFWTTGSDGIPSGWNIQNQ